MVNWTRIQQNTTQVAYVLSASVTLAQVTQGNFLVAVASSAGTTTPTISDTGNLTWKLLTSIVNAGGGAGYAASTFLFGADIDTTIPGGITITVEGADTSVGIRAIEYSPGANATVSILATDAQGAGSLHPILGPLNWTVGIMGLDLIFMTATEYPSNAVSDAGWPAIPGNYDPNGGTIGSGCFGFENLNDASGSVSPGMTIDGTYASLVAVVLGAIDAASPQGYPPNYVIA